MADDAVDGGLGVSSNATVGDGLGLLADGAINSGLGASSNAVVCDGVGLLADDVINCGLGANTMQYHQQIISLNDMLNPVYIKCMYK